MAKEKRRLTVGTEDVKEISKIASKIHVYGGTCDEDEPLAVITIKRQYLPAPYIFFCLPGDILVEYDDGTWNIIEKETRQSRLITPLMYSR